MSGAIEIVATKTVDLEGKETKQDQNGEVFLSCDGPNCQKVDTPCVGKLQWKLPKSEADIAGIPDDAYRIFRLGIGISGSQMTFFSRNCLKEFMREFTPPRSPRELKAIDDNNKKIEEAKAAPAEPAVPPDQLDIPF